MSAAAWLALLLRARAALLAASAALSIAATSCKSSSEAQASPSAAASTGTLASARSSEKPRFVQRPRGSTPLAEFVENEVEQAAREGARVVVYVGATWCEPCQYFHQALEQGELDGALAGIRFLEFDLDRDGPELKAAGYRSEYVPLFALPGSSGLASGQLIEGSIKGPHAVRKNLLPRLEALLAEPAGKPR